MLANSNEKTLITSMDEMFGIKPNVIVNVPSVSLAHPVNHPFSLYAGERFNDMVNDIKENGILVPLIIRSLKDGRYEILSGNNRWICGKEAGLIEFPAIVMNVDDRKAWIIMVHTNIFQRSFKDMNLIERATILEYKHSQLFSQGKRTDIEDLLNNLANPGLKKDRNKTTIDKLGNEYGLSKNTVARLLRLNHLNNDLKTYVAEGKLQFLAAVELSYLNEKDQLLLSKILKLNKFKINITKSQKLRKLFEAGTLDEESIYEVFVGSKITNIGKFTLPKKIFCKYFTPDQSDQEITEIIDKALDIYYNSKKATFS